MHFSSVSSYFRASGDNTANHRYRSRQFEPQGISRTKNSGARFEFDIGIQAPMAGLVICKYIGRIGLAPNSLTPRLPGSFVLSELAPLEKMLSVPGGTAGR